MEHDVTKLVNEHEVASDVTEEYDEKGEATEVKDRLEYFMNENISVDKLEIIFQFKQLDEENASK